MKYINTFETHASYEAKLNGGGVDISLPNVSYCKDVKDIHYNPYNTVEFYVGEITGTTPQTVKIYTDSHTSIDVTVSEENKWYSYLLPKDKGLYKIKSGIYDDEDETWSNGIVKKAVVKADISYSYDGNNDTYNGIVPYSTVEASFKGSNTSKVTDMYGMFYGCSGLTELDVSNFDTSNVDNMDNMFSDCSGLTSLNLSGWDTTNVTTMNSMFQNCKGLTSLTLSNFNTSNVIDMGYMFNGCRNLTSLNLSGWNTSSANDMSWMFEGCSGLTELDVSNFNTSNVIDMGYMFNGCRNLTSLDLSGWDISKVTTMYSMFGGCSGLTSLTLSGWDMSKVTTMGDMFKNCTSLTTIRMKGCSSDTVGKIKTQLKVDGLSEDIVKTE